MQITSMNSHLSARVSSAPIRRSTAPSLPHSGIGVENQLSRSPEELRQELSGFIKRTFPLMQISFSTLQNEKEIEEYAQKAASGFHLVVDPEVLDWMSQGAGAFQQGMDFLSKVYNELITMASDTPNGYSVGAVIGENGEISYWNAVVEEKEEKIENPCQALLDSLEEMKEYRKKQEEAREKNKQKKLTMTQKIGYSAGRDLTRLAKAGTVSDVKKLMARVYARSVSIKGNRRYDKEEVRMTVAQMEGVIRRSRTKIKNLKEEELLKFAQKKAEKRRQQERAIQIALELKKKRTSRRCKEYRQINERYPWVPEFMRPRSPEEQRLEQQQRMEAAGFPVGAAAAAIPGLDGSAAAAGVAAGNPAAQAIAVVSANLNVSVSSSPGLNMMV